MSTTDILNREQRRSLIYGERGGWRVDEWCERYGIARQTLYAWWQQGKGPDYIQAGALRIITPEQDARWQAENTRKPGISEEVE